MSDVLFLESQQFRQIWLWVIIIAVQAATIAGTVVVMRRKNHPKRPRWSRLLMIAVTVLCAIVVALLFVAELRTVVKPNGIYVRFFPFHLDDVKIAPSDLTSANAVTYSPLQDYGGWGIRWGKDGQAYSVSGRRGVLLTFADTSRESLLIGSNQPDTLADAIAKIREQH
ncbi:MAG: hypothetical protein GKR94_02405 [Gammaproteobacteria bacterium]|nr:hypothetical protein [Gammaproteobacteria bacterium]